MTEDVRRGYGRRIMSPNVSAPRRGLSLRTKWTLALFVTGAVPLSLLAFRAMAIQKRGLESDERALEVAIVDHAGSTIDGLLDDASEGTHRVGRIVTEAELRDPDAKIALAREAMARASVLESVAIYGADGRLIDAIARSSGHPVDPPSVVPERASPSDAGGWLPAEVVAGGGALLRWVEPVVRDGKRRAWVLGTVEPELLSRALDDISRDRFEGWSEGILLLDGQARVLASGAKGELAPGASLAGRDVFERLDAAGVLAKPLAVATEFRGVDGAEMLGTVRRLSRFEGAIAVRRSTAVAYGALAASRALFALATATFVVVAALLGAFVGARTTKPILALMELAAAYGRRELSTRSPVKTGDELEQLGASLERMADGLASSEAEIRRRQAVEQSLSRYLPAEVARAIAEGKRSIALGGERRPVSVVFADVAGFTPFAEAAPPERVVAFLNELFGVLAEVVFRHGGTVDKFIGDSVMAIFGAPVALEDHADRALAAAEDMHRFVEASAPAWRETYGVEVRLGIGVNSGSVLVGNLGSEKRMEYTAIGDVVNVAARLEYLARPGQTLATSEVRGAAREAFGFASLGTHQLRGKQQAVEIFEVS